MQEEPASAIEVGFWAIICLESKPLLPPSLGLPPANSYRNTVFLHRTHSPNEMFNCWDNCSNRLSGSPLCTMTIRLDEYLALHLVVRNEWKEIVLKVTATARQLANTWPPS